MIPYCTIDEILSVAIAFRRDVVPLSDSGGTAAAYSPNTYTITRADVDAVCIEATIATRALLAPHYDPDVIDAYVTDGSAADLPPTVNFLAKTLGAILMYQRYGAVTGVERDDLIIASLQRTVAMYADIIEGQVLQDADGVAVPTRGGLQVIPSTTYTAINEATLIPKGTAQYARD